MALVIKGEMPKACNWFDENGKHHFCKVNAFCDCEVYTRGERPSDCPILTEIPDKHGRLIDADNLISTILSCMDAEKQYSKKDFGLVKMVIYHIVKAPTVLEAST